MTRTFFDISTGLFPLADNFPDIASFGVFDGHFGTVAASVCAQHLHKTILKRFERLQSMRSAQKSPLLSSQQHYDAIFCEAIRQVFEEVDENIRCKDNSGCTALSIFLVRNTDDDSIRLYCCNVGDSRGVLFTPYMDGMDHSIPEENDIRDAFYGNDLDRSEHSRILFAFPISEDHKLALRREKMRLEARQDLLWHPLPSNIVKAQMMIHNSLDEVLTPEIIDKQSLQEMGYPPKAVLEAASIFVQSVTEPDAVTVTPRKLVYKTTKTHDSDLPHFKDGERILIEGEEYERIHRNSFIAKRKTANGEEKGPEALFGMYNFSTNMTRSIGDRYGPRSCLAVPDISAVTIRKNEYVRIVIASDGVWDVLKNSEVKDIVLLDRSPEDAAVRIVQRAYNEREYKKLRQDDITAIVVDVNPELFPKFKFSSLLPSALSFSKEKRVETKATEETSSAWTSSPVVVDNSECKCLIS